MLDATAAAICPPASHLCLGFVNTLGWRGRPEPSESLNNFNDLRAWLRTSAGMAAALPSKGPWQLRPEQMASVLAEAIAVREALFGLFSAIATRARVPEADLTRLQRALAAAPQRSHLVRSKKGFAWHVERMRPSAPHLLAPVLWSAADLLVSADRHRLRLCADPECLWLFLDASRNAARLWCDMAACGNRAKARRHYQRSRQA